MRISELIESHLALQEGGASGSTRYNSELGIIYGLIWGDQRPDFNVVAPGGVAAKPTAQPVKKPTTTKKAAPQPAEQEPEQQPEQQPQAGYQGEYWDKNAPENDLRLSESTGYQLTLNGKPATIEQAFPPNRVEQNVLGEIAKWLFPNFDKAMFDQFAAKGAAYQGIIGKQTGGWNGQFNWVGGVNKGSNAADVGFVGSKIAGISVKADTGITLSNLTPESLGLYKGIFDDQGNQMVREKGKKKGQLMWDTSDVLGQHAYNEWLDFKQKCFSAVMDLADREPGKQFGWHEKTPEKYYIVSDGAGTYTCAGKNKFSGSKADILSAAGKNLKWQRVFGDWAIANWSQAKEFAKPMIAKLSADLLTPMNHALNDSEKLANALRMSNHAYFYLSKDGLYFVPTKDAVHHLALKKIEFGNPEGATMKFYAYIGERAKGGTKTNTADARVEIHIRYANGLFEASPTVRVQGLTAPEGLTWIKVAD